jgi:FkbM family methyltransferase
MNFEDFNKISYIDENYNIINHNAIETNEQKQAFSYVPEDGTVLELGARYGTVSCVINFKLKNKTRQVSVEPDLRVLSALYKNKELHQSQFIIFNGVISNVNMKLCQDNNNGYGNYCTKTEESFITKITLQKLIEQTGLNFDVLVADCEGFLEQFFDENWDYINNFKVIMYERDYPHRCNYNKIENYLTSLGFKCVNQLGDMHVVFSK